MLNRLMKGHGISFPLGKIPFTIQYDFFLIGVLFYFSSGMDGFAVAELLVWIGVSILLHELGHALAGSYFGLKPQIRLLFLGGVTIWERNAAILSPRRHILIALAGPGAGFLFGGFVWMVMTYVGWWPAFAIAPKVLLWYLLLINLVWGAVNLLPIYPMDGGQVLNQALRYQKRFNPDVVTSLAAVVLITAGMAVTLWRGDIWLALLLLWMGWANVRRLVLLRDQPQKAILDQAEDLLDSAPMEAYRVAIELLPRLWSQEYKATAMAIAGYGLYYAQDEEEARRFAVRFPDYGDFSPALALWLIRKDKGKEEALSFAKKAFAKRPAPHLASYVLILYAETNDALGMATFAKMIRRFGWYDEAIAETAEMAAQVFPAADAHRFFEALWKVKSSPGMAYRFAEALVASSPELSVAWIQKVAASDAEMAAGAASDEQFASLWGQPAFVAAIHSGRAL